MGGKHIQANELLVEATLRGTHGLAEHGVWEFYKVVTITKPNSGVRT
jgi:hypothetical protein